MCAAYGSKNYCFCCHRGAIRARHTRCHFAVKTHTELTLDSFTSECQHTKLLARSTVLLSSFTQSPSGFHQLSVRRRVKWCERRQRLHLAAASSLSEHSTAASWNCASKQRREAGTADDGNAVLCTGSTYLCGLHIGSPEAARFLGTQARLGTLCPSWWGGQRAAGHIAASDHW